MTERLVLSFLCGLITWRIASLLHTEDAFEWLRDGIGIGEDEHGYPAVYPDNVLGKIFDCFWCLSTVVALPVALILTWWAGEHLAWALPVWLAASTVAIWTEKQILRAQSR